MEGAVQRAQRLRCRRHWVPLRRILRRRGCQYLLLLQKLLIVVRCLLLILRFLPMILLPPRLCLRPLLRGMLLLLLGSLCRLDEGAWGEQRGGGLNVSWLPRIGDAPT